jgi:hypothetical protein
VLDVLLLERVFVDVPVRPKLVLDLDQDHRPAVRVQQRLDPGQQLLLHVRVHGFDVRVVERADLHAGLGQQPGGQAAEVPLGADVRAGPRDDKETELLRQLHEAHQVAVAAEVELALVLLVHVPRNVPARGTGWGGGG